jgi:ribonuclease P protein component
MNKPFSLSKNERLKSKKNIDTLFLNGKAFFVFPYSVKFLIFDELINPEEALKLVASVPKRKFKRANKRNTIRRRLKESYRINKVELKQLLMDKNKSMHLLITYNANEELPYQEMNESMKKVLQILGEKII